jgi:cation diffusion facilitator family transporter
MRGIEAGTARPPGREARALAAVLVAGLLRLAVGLASGSLAVLADAMQSVTRGFSILTGLLAQRLSDPRPDRDHPYGHHKYEAVGSLAIAAVILMAALEILRGSWERIAAAAPPPRLDTAGALLLALALALQMFGRGSPPATWRAWASQVLPSLAVLAGVGAASALKLAWLDLALAVPLALLLIGGCLVVLRDKLPVLVDRIAIAPEAIHALAMGVPGVLNCHDIASRGVVGQQVFIDMHLVVEANDLPTAHRITELVEERLEARYGPTRCTIHLEPREYASAAITFRGTHG